MQCTRLPATREEEQKEEIITTQTATIIPRNPAVAGDPLLQPTAVMEVEQCHGRQQQQQLLRLTEVDLESGHCETVRLIPDCLEHIFKYLSTCDKGRVAQVSHLWRDVCYRHSLWKDEAATLRLSQTNKDILHSIRFRGIKKFKIREHKSNLELITRTFDTITSLDISGCYYTTDEAMEKAFSSAREFTELKIFTLNYCSNLTEQGLCFALSRMPGLETLSLRGCRQIRIGQENVKECVRTSCKNLEYLSIAGCKQMGVEDLSGVLDGMTNLREIDLEDCDHIHDECLQCIASAGLLQLEKLNLSFCVSIFDPGLQAIAGTLPNLTKLQLRSVDNVTSYGIAAVLLGCPSLKILDLAHCDWLTDNTIEDIALRRIARHHPPGLRVHGEGALNTLEELDLSCAKISDDGVRLISEHMPGLKHLKIGQCLMLTDTSLTHIGANLVNLVTIDAYGCKFSAQAINNIWDNLSHLTKINLFMFL